jgi:hypothetical protein
VHANRGAKALVAIMNDEHRVIGSCQ